MQIMRTKKVSKEFELKNVGEYHVLYVQNRTLLLADVFEYFRNMCLKIYELATALKRTKVKLDLLTNIDVFNDRKRYYKRNMSIYL